jgi:hypothetical protein
MASLFHVECPKCGAKSKQGARFCGSCGSRLPGSEIKCGNCGAVVAADKAYCGNCGKPLSESAAALLRGNRWARRTDDFATKVEVDDVEGFFKKGLIVESGTKAIFFVNGAYSGILEPGRYDMGGMLQRIKDLFNHKTTTAVLMDAGDVELEFSVADLATRDPIKLVAECSLVVHLDSATQFFENLMKGRQNYPLPELKTFLEGELRNCLVEFVGLRSVQELSANLAFKQQMEQGVAQHLAKTFDRKGLGFVQVRIFNFRHPRMDALTNKMEEYWLHAEDLKVRLAGGDSTLGLERKLLDQETAQGLMQLEVFEDRAKIYDRMRKAVASDKMNQVTTQNELEKFLQGIDKDKILSNEEMRALVQDFDEKRENHDLARRHLIQKMRLEQDIDLARVELLGKISMNRTVSDAERDEQMAQLEHQMAAQRKQIEHRQAMEWSQMTQELETQKSVADVEVDIGKKKADAEFDQTRKSVELQVELGKKVQETELDLGVRKAEAGLDLDRKRKLSEIEIEDLKDQADMRTAAASLDILKKQKTIKKEEADADLERDQRARGAASEIAMKETAQRHQLELEKIQAMASLSTEALIAAAPADRATMIAELKRTETLKGFSEEQILAMAAEKNPEVARAFQEKFKSASGPEIQKAYERMLTMKDQGIADLKAMSGDYARMMQEMYNRGMETQRDTAMAAARGSQPAMTVVAPGMGPATVIRPDVPAPPEAPPAGRKITCPECGVEAAAGPKFCDNCGHKFV